MFVSEAFFMFYVETDGALTCEALLKDLEVFG